MTGTRNIRRAVSGAIQAGVWCVTALGAGPSVPVGRATMDLMGEWWLKPASHEELFAAEPRLPEPPAEGQADGGNSGWLRLTTPGV